LFFLRVRQSRRGGHDDPQFGSPHSKPTFDLTTDYPVIAGSSISRL